MSVSQTLNITTIQTELVWEDKEANINKIEQKIKGIDTKTEIIVLPEMFSTGFSMQPHLFAETMDGSTIQWMKNVSAAQKVILTGSVIIEEEGEYFNRLIWMMPNGNFGYYDKRHLFAYGNEDKFYTAGNKRLIAQVNGWKINLQVCYDLRFPVWSRQTPPPSGEAGRGLEYDVLIYVANWPQKRNHAWKTLLTARAIENQCFVIGVNRVGNDGNNIFHSGDTSVINALGETLYTKADDEDVHTITLHKNELNEVREKFPFWKDADEFKII